VTAETSPANTQMITLTSDDYLGVKYYYSTVNFEERDDDAYLTFEYHIVDNPTGENLDGDKQFGDHLGMILTDIIEYGLELNDSSRTDDTNTPPSE